MPNLERLDSISWDGIYMSSYRACIDDGGEDADAHKQATDYVRVLRNICAGACMSEAELDEERRRFDAEAAEVEKDLKLLMTKARYEGDQTELKRRLEKRRYWKDLRENHHDD